MCYPGSAEMRLMPDLQYGGVWELRGGDSSPESEMRTV